LLTVEPVPPPALSGLTVNPGVVVGGNSSVGTVVLTAPAPSGGAIVTLRSSNPQLASVASSVFVTAGATSANFAVTTTPTHKSSSVTLFAGYGGVTKTATITVTRK
jgi:hypothetical protein